MVTMYKNNKGKVLNPKLVSFLPSSPNLQFDDLKRKN